MKPETLSILRSPVTGNCLQFNSEQTALVDVVTGQRFPIEAGIPRFLSEEVVTGSNLKYQQMYDGFAARYDLSQRFIYFFMGSEARVRRTMLKGLDVKDGDRVLEVSVGTGGNFRVLPQSCHFYGLDISLGMLSECRRNVDRWQLDAELFHGAAEQLPFADNSFDVVYHVGGINFFNDRRKALEEMIRVAKPGTRIIVSDETERAAKAMNNSAVGGEFYRNRAEAIAPPAALLPDHVADVQVDAAYFNLLYRLSFRKAL